MIDDASDDEGPAGGPDEGSYAGSDDGAGEGVDERSEEGRGGLHADAEEGRVGAPGPVRPRRVFFALWPDDTVRGAISRASRDIVGRSGGRPTAKRNQHVTVAFLGSVDESGLERAMQVPPISVGAFDLALDALGFWHESRTLWLAPREVPAALSALERSLWDGLEQRGFERERRTYRPHLTLARRARPVEAEITAVEWTVAALTLVESVPLPQGVHYEPLAEWPL